VLKNKELVRLVPSPQDQRAAFPSARHLDSHHFPTDQIDVAGSRLQDVPARVNPPRSNQINEQGHHILNIPQISLGAKLQLD
jgi:hypothetical protein